MARSSKAMLGMWWQLMNPHLLPEVVLTYTQLNQKIQCFAAGLQALLLAPGDRSALIADNSPHWLIADKRMLLYVQPILTKSCWLGKTSAR